MARWLASRRVSSNARRSRGSHRIGTRPTGKNEAYAYSYLFAYTIDVPANAKTLTLPNNDNVRILAITGSNERAWRETRSTALRHIGTMNIVQSSTFRLLVEAQAKS